MACCLAIGEPLIEADVDAMGHHLHWASKTSFESASDSPGVGEPGGLERRHPAARFPDSARRFLVASMIGPQHRDAGGQRRLDCGGGIAG
jgi:hypothetical protein